MISFKLLFLQQAKRSFLVIPTKLKVYIKQVKIAL